MAWCERFELIEALMVYEHITHMGDSYFVVAAIEGLDLI